MIFTRSRSASARAQYCSEKDEKLRARGGVETLDWDFIRGNSLGFKAVAAGVKATCWEDIERRSALSRNAIEAAGRIYMKAERHSGGGMGLIIVEITPARTLDSANDRGMQTIMLSG